MTEQRSIFIGDVHGCTAELAQLLDAVAPAPGDRLFFVGDLVDRGPDSLGAIRAVRDLLTRFPGSACVAGNHEEGALRARERGRPSEGWAAKASRDDWAFLDSLPLLHRVEDLGVVVVHGGFFPRFFEIYGGVGTVGAHWRKERGKRADRARRFLRVRKVDAAGNQVSLADERPGDAHWSATYAGAEGFCFFGHDPQLDPPLPLSAPHAMGIDTGCCFGGRLTAAVVTRDPRRPQWVAVEAHAVYAEPRSRAVDE